MQQLFAAFGVNWSLLIAQAINFAIVFGALWYFLYKPVMSTLDERRRIVAQGVEDAEKASEKLAAADDVAADRVKKADAEAKGIVTTAREAADAEKARILKEAESRAASLSADASARASEDAARMKRESEKDIARLAVLAAEKVLKEKHAR